MIILIYASKLPAPPIPKVEVQPVRTGDRGGEIERGKRKIMDLQLQSERRLRGVFAE